VGFIATPTDIDNARELPKLTVRDHWLSATANGSVVLPIGVKCPSEVYSASPRTYAGLPDLSYPLHDRDVLVTACGRICMHRKRINISTVLAGRRLGITEVDEGIWLVSFMSYDLGFIDLEQKTLQPIDNPFGPRLSPMS
jgi:hypothetical protein